MDTWIEYYKYILGENRFIKDNINIYSSLTMREKELISLLAFGYSVKNIAMLMQVKESTVKRYQHNLRKKLLELQHDLPRFAQAFELDE